jgi:hypothetical protein
MEVRLLHSQAAFYLPEIFSGNKNIVERKNERKWWEDWYKEGKSLGYESSQIFEYTSIVIFWDVRSYSFLKR